MRKIAKAWRQGDVYIKAIDAIPAGKRTKRANGWIMNGEQTGHVHRVAELEAAEVLEVGSGLYLNVTAEGGVSIVHDEHHTLTLPPGNYEVTRQMEYSPESIRSVMD